MPVLCNKPLQVIIAPQVLGPLMRVSPAYGKVVSDVFALIAYRDPASSALAELLSFAAREATADVLNSAILAAAAPPPDGGLFCYDSPCSSYTVIPKTGHAIRTHKPVNLASCTLAWARVYALPTFECTSNQKFRTCSLCLARKHTRLRTCRRAGFHGLGGGSRARGKAVDSRAGVLAAWSPAAAARGRRHCKRRRRWRRSCDGAAGGARVPRRSWARRPRAAGRRRRRRGGPHGPGAIRAGAGAHAAHPLWLYVTAWHTEATASAPDKR